MHISWRAPKFRYWCSDCQRLTLRSDTLTLARYGWYHKQVLWCGPVDVGPFLGALGCTVNWLTRRS